MVNTKAGTAAEILRLRLDKWLWAARFYKSRALAQQAIEQSQVLVSERPVKVSRLVHCGDLLLIYAREDHAKEVRVCALSSQRQAFAEAQKLYQETPESLEKREARLALRRFAPELVSSRPDRNTRRLLLEFKKHDHTPFQDKEIT